MEIKAGDLVMVVRQHCADSIEAGLIRVVEEIDVGRYSLMCGHCKQFFARGEPMVRLGDRHSWHPLAWVKKIDPPAIPESIERDESITA